MPLHLLGKKSWNVYNADNIARVQRDEALEKAKEEEEERRMQEVDAERRLLILRGEEPLPISAAEAARDDEKPLERDRDRDRGHARGASGAERPKRKRKRTGEDDTDFELRLATERSAPFPGSDISRKPTSSAPIVDHAGHIDLLGEAQSRARPEKNPEAERDAARKKREYEDQFTMRLSNAAGRDGQIKAPWYSQSDADKQLAASSTAPPSKNVFGREDPDRPAREARRLADSDPLAAMRSGAARVRDLKRERRAAREERERELVALRREDRRGEERRRAHHQESRRQEAGDEERSGSRRGERSGRSEHHADDGPRVEERRNRGDREHGVGRKHSSSRHGSKRDERGRVEI